VLVRFVIGGLTGQELSGGQPQSSNQQQMLESFQNNGQVSP